MLDILKKEAKTGDKIKLFLISGQEPQGEILEISDSFIRLMTQEGKEARLFDKLIGGWEILESRNKEPQKEKTAEPKDVIVLDDNTPKASEKKEPFQKIIEENHSDEEIEKPTLPGLKIVGKIDLDKIQPKKAKRKNEIPKTNSIRLIRAAKDLNLTMSQLVELAKELSIRVQPQSSFPISQSDFKKIKSYHSSNSEQPELTKEQSSKNALKLHSLGDLKGLKDKIITEEGKAFIPPTGIIKRYGRNGYGFITDKENNDYFFRISSIEDTELREKLESSQDEIGTAVVCTFNNNNGKLIASNIRLSEPIENLFKQVESFYKSNDIKSSQDLLLLILDSFPDYTPARDLLHKIKYDRSKARKSKQNASNSYFRAKTELSHGNLEEAKKYFEEALSLTDHRVENVIKELAYLYQREGNWSKAVELVQENSKKFKTSDPNSFIAFFFESEKIYDKAVEYLEKVKSGSKNDNIKLIKRKANAYYRLDRYDEAEQFIRQVLKDQPEDRISQKILEGLKQARISGKYEEELEVIFNEAELASFSGGLSPFIKESLLNCEYRGIPSTIVTESKFQKRHLKELRQLIDSIEKGRPKDRANYLLTEAKLMELLEPEREVEMQAVLTKYCIAISQYAAIENRPQEVVRFYLLEAFRASKTTSHTFGAISPFIPFYLYTFSKASSIAYKSLSQDLAATVSECLDSINIKVWQGLTDLFIVNPEVFSRLLALIYKNKEIRVTSLEFIEGYLDIDIKKDLNSEKYREQWKSVTEKRRIINQNLNSEFEAVLAAKSSEQFAETFLSTKKKNFNHFNQFDQYRINQLNEIIEYVFDFNRSSDFEDKERYNNLIQTNVTSFNSEVEDNPTEFSFNILRKLSSKIEKLILTEYAQVIATSSPELDLRLASEGILHQDENLVNFQIIVLNKKGSAPISSFEIVVEDSEEYTFNHSDNISEITLKGGQERPLRLTLTMSRNSSEITAIPLNVVCKYKIRGSDDEKLFNRTLTLRFYSETEFERIDNPFATTADSGPVEDPSMFFGREEFLDNVTESILGSGAKCIIIYGQKRSGKSSVLFHLKERLNDDSNAFCIQFSLGEIIEDLSSEVFYYKVLSEIEDALDILREHKYLVPEFECPNLNDLSKAPAIVFNEKLKVLRKRMQSLEGWSDKKLVLLLDEFTYIYTAIKRGILSDQFMKSWKSFLEKGHFTSVLIGQDIMPKFTSAYPNEFGVTEPRRLSYLRKGDAKKLIEKPVWDKKRNQSRFIGNALDLILDYTSSNPYYIQIFCARMVEHMHRIKAITATEADVEEVALSFIKGADALTPDKFDNLITAGDAEVESFPPEQVLLAIKEIALATKNLSSCSRDALKNKESVTDQILEDLQTREVIDCPQPGYYKINVRLFKEWLLKN